MKTFKIKNITYYDEPLEKDEQSAFVKWLDLQGLKYTAIPNSTFTKSIKQKMHNKNQGLRAGFPDMVVIVPAERTFAGFAHILFIEMKRQKSGVLSEYQKEWIAALRNIGGNVDVQVCKGCDEAITFVHRFLADIKNDLF